LLGKWTAEASTLESVLSKSRGSVSLLYRPHARANATCGGDVPGPQTGTVGAQFLSSAALLGSGTAVLLDVGLYCFLAVASGVNYMTRRDMSMVRRCFMTSSLVMLCSFLMMARRMH
jgi:hypothetical protein